MGIIIKNNPGLQKHNCRCNKEFHELREELGLTFTKGKAYGGDRGQVLYVWGPVEVYSAHYENQDGNLVWVEALRKDPLELSAGGQGHEAANWIEALDRAYVYEADLRRHKRELRVFKALGLKCADGQAFLAKLPQGLRDELVVYYWRAINWMAAADCMEEQGDYELAGKCRNQSQSSDCG